MIKNEKTKKVIAEMHQENANKMKASPGVRHHGPMPMAEKIKGLETMIQLQSLTPDDMNFFMYMQSAIGSSFVEHYDHLDTKIFELVTKLDAETIKRYLDLKNILAFTAWRCNEEYADVFTAWDKDEHTLTEHFELSIMKLKLVATL